MRPPKSGRSGETELRGGVDGKNKKQLIHRLSRGRKRQEASESVVDCERTKKSGHPSREEGPGNEGGQTDGSSHQHENLETVQTVHRSFERTRRERADEKGGEAPQGLSYRKRALLKRALGLREHAEKRTLRNGCTSLLLSGQKTNTATKHGSILHVET